MSTDNLTLHNTTPKSIQLKSETKQPTLVNACMMEDEQE
jgi:hypothetical protein